MKKNKKKKDIRVDSGEKKKSLPTFGDRFRFLGTHILYVNSKLNGKDENVTSV